MKTQIRHGMFETNSSSSHSLSYYADANKTLQVDKHNETISLGIGEYGWEYEELTEWLEKADYLAIECDCSRDKQELLLRVLHRAYKNTEFEIKSTGYIDHQSSGEIWNEILGDTNPEEYLYNVIFGSSVIIIDNDNN